MPLSIVFALEISGSTKNFILLVLVLFLICKITEIPESGYKKVPPFPDKCGTINKKFDDQAAATVFLLIPITQPTIPPTIADITAVAATSAATTFKEFIVVDVA